MGESVAIFRLGNGDILPTEREKERSGEKHKHDSTNSADLTNNLAELISNTMP